MEEKILVFLKPDAVLRRGVSSRILEELISFSNLTPYKIFWLHLTEEMAMKHYKAHKDKQFFPWLVRYVTLSPVLGIFAKGEKLVERLRRWAGSTLVEEASPHSIRGKFGIQAGVNTIHISDSTKSAEKEIILWERFIRKGAIVTEKEIKNFIRRWRDAPLYTKELREILREFMRNLKAEKQSIEELKEYLRKECLEIEENLIHRFASLLVENAKVRARNSKGTETVQ